MHITSLPAIENTQKMAIRNNSELKYDTLARIWQILDRPYA
jgi:hypothetical protein